MLKVLGTGATSETCLLALNETSWDVHRAIKLCQVTRALDKQVSAGHRDKQVRRSTGHTGAEQAGQCGSPVTNRSVRATRDLDKLNKLVT